MTYSITVLAPGHSLVINQIFTGGNGSTILVWPQLRRNVQCSRLHRPTELDDTDWRHRRCEQAFTRWGRSTRIRRDYRRDRTQELSGLSDLLFRIWRQQYGLTATSPQLNAAYPPLHCWLNRSVYASALGHDFLHRALTALPQIAPDLDLTDGYVNGTRITLTRAP